MFPSGPTELKVSEHDVVMKCVCSATCVCSSFSADLSSPETDGKVTQVIFPPAVIDPKIILFMLIPDEHFLIHLKLVPFSFTSFVIN